VSLALRFRRRFSMAHRLTSGAASKCATPHGHDEYVTVELVAAEPRALDGQANMVAEFGKAKGRWHRFVDERLDHGLQLAASDPLLAIARERFPEWRLIVTPGDPTTELLAALLAAKCQAILDDELDGALRVRRVILDETPTNAVVFEGDPREVLPAGDGWWWRADERTA
jgi:6-pyruvoyltetrahydropterin/6-carboxytetrahydropterin synthase